MPYPPWLQGAPMPKTFPERRALTRQLRSPRYRGWQPLAGLTLGTLAPAAAAIAWVPSWGWPELAAVLVAIVVGALVQYLTHRFVLHKRRLQPFFYDAHVAGHHMFFGGGTDTMEDLDDVDMVMMPLNIAAGLCVVFNPIMAAPWLAVGWGPALASLATGWVYYWAFELMHVAAHAPLRWGLGELPVLGWFCWHHRRHHAFDVMHKANFSTLIPLWDIVLRTLVTHRDASTEEA